MDPYTELLQVPTLSVFGKSVKVWQMHSKHSFFVSNIM